MSENLRALKQDVDTARQWALDQYKEMRYLGENITPSTLLDRPRVIIEFPDIDRMAITPISYGQLIEPARAEYQLCWRGGWLYWVGDFVLRRVFLRKHNEIEYRIGPACGKPE